GEIALARVAELGMAGEPAVSLKAVGAVSGQEAKCRELLTKLFERAKGLLLEHHEALMRLTEALLQQETLSGEEVDRILGSLSNDSPDSANVDPNR
ncbi:MAG: hypothetical protein Q4C70_09955, partial [Planctomycetia bacterium]|nr:hypothetical protein [Planctomycetia bacterium]